MGVVNKAKAAGEDANGNDTLDAGQDVNSYGILQYGLPLILGKLGPLAIDLRDGFTFTTGAAGTTKDQYPKVDSVTLGQSQSDQRAVVAGTPTTSVPRTPTLVMNFSQPMHEGSVKDSTLRITDITGGDDNPSAHAANYSFDIQIQAAITASPPLATLAWTSDHKSVTLTFAHTLMPGNRYRLQMVDNQAKAAGANDDQTVTGLPLILGGTIDLLSGFVFEANNAPTITHLKDADNAIVSSKAIDEDGLINLTVAIADDDPSADWPEVSAGQHELIVTAVSDDQILLPNGNIALAGSGSTRTVTLSPAADQHGSVVITFKVSDGIDQT